MRIRSHHAIGAAVALLMVAPCGAITIQEDNGPAVQAGDTDAGAAGVVVPHVKEENGIAYISGGRGTEELHALEAAGGKYNLKLTLAAPNGEFIVPDTLKIADQAGKVLVETRPQGPLFLARLPAGAYSVTASSGGKDVTRAVTVPGQGQEALNLTMNPPESLPRAGDAPDVAAPPAANAPEPQPEGGSSGAVRQPEAE
jgi:hypothetical protein